MRLRFGSSQPVPVSTACTHVARRLRVGIRCVEKYRFVSILRCRSIVEASPLDDDVHSKIPVGVERSSAFHLVVIAIRLRERKNACTRGWCWLTCAPDRWHSRACRVSASVAPQQGHLIARNSSIPRKRRPAYKNSGARMTLDESTGFALKKAVAPGPNWLLYRALAKPLVSFSPSGFPVPRGGFVSGSCSREATYLS